MKPESSARSETLNGCTIAIDESHDSTDVTIVGELDLSDTDRVAVLLGKACTTSAPVVRLHLRELIFADSSALTALLIASTAARANDVRFELVEPHGQMRRLLDVSNLVDSFTIVDEPEDQAPPR